MQGCPAGRPHKLLAQGAMVIHVLSLTSLHRSLPSTRARIMANSNLPEVVGNHLIVYQFQFFSLQLRPR
jgi:hypothetical protein